MDNNSLSIYNLPYSPRNTRSETIDWGANDFETQYWVLCDSFEKLSLEDAPTRDSDASMDSSLLNYTDGSNSYYDSDDEAFDRLETLLATYEQARNLQEYFPSNQYIVDVNLTKYITTPHALLSFQSLDVYAINSMLHITSFLNPGELEGLYLSRHYSGIIEVLTSILNNNFIMSYFG